MIEINLVGQRAVYFEPCVVARTATGMFHPMGKRPSVLDLILGSRWVVPFVVEEENWMETVGFRHPLNRCLV